jgi:hypothetical protein
MYRSGSTRTEIRQLDQSRAGAHAHLTNVPRACATNPHNANTSKYVLDGTARRGHWPACARYSNSRLGNFIYGPVR